MGLAIAITILIVAPLAYWLGYSDGKLSAEEEDLFKRFDAYIEKLAERPR